MFVTIELVIAFGSLLSALLGICLYLTNLLRKFNKHIESSILFEEKVDASIRCLLTFVRDSYNYNGLSADLSQTERNERLTTLRKCLAYKI